MVARGDIVKFKHIYNNCDLNYKLGIYMGECPPIGPMNVINHAVWIPGMGYRIIDKGLLGSLYMVGGSKDD